MTEERTYIIANDVYMHEKYDMREYIGTSRQLLEYLNGVTEENREEEFGAEGKVIADFTDKELVDIFDQANGDGQPYYTVWCVEERRKVIG